MLLLVFIYHKDKSLHIQQNILKTTAQKKTKKYSNCFNIKQKLMKQNTVKLGIQTNKFF